MNRSGLRVALSSIVLAVALVAALAPSFSAALLVAMIVSFVFELHRQRDSNVTFVFLFFAFSYVANMAFFFWGGLPTSSRLVLQSVDLYSRTLVILAFFFEVLFLLVRPPNRYVRVLERLPRHDNAVFFWTSLSLAVLLSLTVRGSSVFATGYSSLVTTAFVSAALYEYALLFAVLALVFTGSSRTRRLSLAVFLIVYAARSVALGDRITVIQSGLLLFIVYFDGRISCRRLLLALVLAFVVLDAFGVVRQRPTLLLSGDLQSFLSEYVNRDIVINNQGDVFYSTTAIINLAADPSVSEAAHGPGAFLAFVASIIFPRAVLPPAAVPESYVRSFFSIGGGGLLPGYGFYWMSLLGTAAASMATAWIFNVLNGRINNGVSIFYATLAFITFPRWFAYSPITLVRLCLFGTIAYVVLHSFHRASGSPHAT